MPTAERTAAAKKKADAIEGAQGKLGRLKEDEKKAQIEVDAALASEDEKKLELANDELAFVKAEIENVEAALQKMQGVGAVKAEGTTDLKNQGTENAITDIDEKQNDAASSERGVLMVRHKSHTPNYFRCGIRFTKQFEKYEVSIETAELLVTDEWLEIKEAEEDED